MMTQTKSQKDMKQAYIAVSEVALKPDEVKKIYKGLCQNFPVMVRTCGLCQAVAFSEDKACDQKDRGTAHGLLLDHVATILGVDRAKLLSRVLDGSAEQYIFDTRRVLSAWIYFKRFAVSILDPDGKLGDA